MLTDLLAVNGARIEAVRLFLEAPSHACFLLVASRTDTFFFTEHVAYVAHSKSFTPCDAFTVLVASAQHDWGAGGGGGDLSSVCRASCGAALLSFGVSSFPDNPRASACCVPGRYISGKGYEVYRVSLSPSFEGIPFNEVARLVYEEAGTVSGLLREHRRKQRRRHALIREMFRRRADLLFCLGQILFGVEVTLRRNGRSKVIVNPGPLPIPSLSTFDVKGFVIAKDEVSSLPGAKEIVRL